MLILGKPGKRKANFIQILIAFIDGFILAFSVFMMHFLFIRADEILRKTNYLSFNDLLMDNKINNSLEFLIFVFHKMTFIDYAYIFIMTFVIMLITLRMTVWAGEDDRIIL